VGVDDAGTVAQAASRVAVIAMVRSIAVLAFLITTNAHAQWQYDPRSVSMLPPYCKYTQIYRGTVPGGNNPAEIQRWSTVMGSHNFIHMHHYCFGLEHTNGALYFARTKPDRDGNLVYAIREFDYVIRNVASDFAVLPEILTKKGENLIRLGEAPQGILELNRAIELKPDYWPPYAALSDHYKATGDTALARQWLEKGLSAVPATKALQRRLEELNAPKARRKGMSRNLLNG
jgi:hypothetical protein